MPADFESSDPRSSDSWSNRRSAGRVLQQGVACDLGPVLDISAGGMRILSTRSRKGRVQISLMSSESKMSLVAQAVWSVRIGFRRHLIGLQFQDLDDAAQQRLASIAMRHRIKQAA